MLFWLLFKIFVVFNLLLSIVVVIAVYKHERKKVLATRQGKRFHRMPPSVSVVVPAHNEEVTIVRCLESIFVTRYERLQVVVVDDGSSDTTSKLVRGYKKQHGLDNLRLIRLRNNRGKGGAMNYAIKTYVDTDITMIVDADVTLARDAIARSVAHFRDAAVQGVASNVRIAPTRSLLGRLQRIEFMVGFFHKKFYDATRSEFIIGGQGSSYRTHALRTAGYFDERMQTEDIALSINVLTNAKPGQKIVFGSDVLVYTEAVATFKELLRQRYRWKFGALQALAANNELLFSRDKKYSRFMTWYRIPNVIMSELMLLIEPIVLLLFAYIAIVYGNPFIFLGAWLTFSLYVGAIVLSDQYLSLRDRLGLALYVPLLFPAFYVFNYINVHNMVRCVKNWKQLTGKMHVKGAWVSPKRTGARI